MPSTRPLQYPPIFDGRIVQYPSAELVKDYFRWRAVDSESRFEVCVCEGMLIPRSAY